MEASSKDFYWGVGKEMSRGILFTIILAGILSIIAIASLGYVNLQNMTNIPRVKMTNTTIVGNETGGNATAPNTQTSSALEGDNMDMISDAPKCLGSALCPD
ncbi:MAG TPA: hypothetical protein VJ250_00675 [Nitrososphaeraceae archaeon]|nr:hypothetical protein [Nitrososphaeraceae archaeon]